MYWRYRCTFQKILFRWFIFLNLKLNFHFSLVKLGCCLGNTIPSFVYFYFSFHNWCDQKISSDGGGALTSRKLYLVKSKYFPNIWCMDNVSDVLIGDSFWLFMSVACWRFSWTIPNILWAISKFTSFDFLF